jgi:hypothetical protein
MKGTIRENTVAGMNGAVRENTIAGMKGRGRENYNWDEGERERKL